MSVGRRLSWVVWGLTILLLAGALTIAIRNGSLSEDPFFAVLAIVMMVGYVSIGTLVASRLPSSPIGWLMLATGTGFLVSVSTSDYAIYTLYTTRGACRSGRSPSGSRRGYSCPGRRRLAGPQVAGPGHGRVGLARALLAGGRGRRVLLCAHLADAGGGTGLQGMADRLDAIGGSLEIRSNPGEGTTILGRVPVD
jgi:hypothetical protein